MIEQNIKGPVLVISAVTGESEPIAGFMERKKTWNPGKRPGFHGRLFNKEAFILTTGPGTVNTAHALGAALEHVRPGLILQCGCAGIFAQSAGKIGDVGIAESETDVHMGIEPPEPLDVITIPLPFQLIDAEHGPSPNTFNLNGGLVAMAQSVLTENIQGGTFSILKGPFITVSTITATDERAARLYSAFSPLMESMEGAASAQVAAHAGIPFLQVRAASNRVGKRNKDEWNLPLAFRNSAMAALCIIEHLSIQD